MSPGAFAHAVDRFARREPFRPFTVELTGGDRVEIDRRDALAYRGGSATFLSPAGKIVFLDAGGVATVSAVVGD